MGTPPLKLEGTEPKALPAVERTYVLVDGENIYTTLYSRILQKKPTTDHRPDWDRVQQYVTSLWKRPSHGIYYFNAGTSGYSQPFADYLRGIGYRVVAVKSDKPEEKVVDSAIKRTLEAIAKHPEGNVILVSHDSDFIGEVSALHDGRRRLALLGFTEHMSRKWDPLRESVGLEFLDLEWDAKSIPHRLPGRYRIIPIEEFDPEDFL